MNRGKRPAPKSLGAAEQAVMDYVWSHPKVTADQCREALQATWPMKESTMRTVLRRLEAKGYVSHAVDGRTYVYSAAEAPPPDDATPQQEAVWRATLHAASTHAAPVNA